MLLRPFWDIPTPLIGSFLCTTLWQIFALLTQDLSVPMWGPTKVPPRGNRRALMVLYGYVCDTLKNIFQLTLVPLYTIHHAYIRVEK